jgi:hypothetical protein
MLADATAVVCAGPGNVTATVCRPGYYVTPAGTCTTCPANVVNAASVVCSDATNSEATACNVGFYLANGGCSGTALEHVMGMWIAELISMMLGTNRNEV